MASYGDPSLRRVGLPLCRTYQLVRFADQPIRVPAAACEQAWHLTWALGAHAEGQLEVLGVWMLTVDCKLDWPAVFAELRLRGVEQIRFALHADAGATQAAFPQVVLLDGGLRPPQEKGYASQGGVQSLLSLRNQDIASQGRRQPPRHIQQMVRHCGEAAKRLPRGMMPAAVRAGPFACGSTAAAFVAAWLTQAEHRHRRRRIAMQWQAVRPMVAAPL